MMLLASCGLSRISYVPGMIYFGNDSCIYRRAGRKNCYYRERHQLDGD